MSTRALLEDLKTVYSQLVIYDDKTAVLPAGIDTEINIDAGKPVKEWVFFNKKDKKAVDPLVMTELMKVMRQDLAEIWFSINERASTKTDEHIEKSPLENLEAGGFDLSSEPELTSEQKEEEEEKARLARKENERLLADLEKFEQEKEKAEPPAKNGFKKPVEHEAIYSQPEDVYETAPTPKKGVVKLLDIIYDLVEDDLVQFFGKTGTCKTSISIQAALEARTSGKSVYYLDTEKNISKKKRTAMKTAGVIYTPYTPSNSTGEFKTVNDLIALHEFIKKIQKVDVLIVDSLGLPVLSVFCEGNQKDQGLSIQKMINISKYLKSYANKNQSLVIVINQPESDMNKDPKIERRSFGEKAEFYYKELLKTFFVEKTDTKTTVVVKTYRSRDYGQGYKLFTVEITDKGVKVIQ